MMCDVPSMAVFVRNLLLLLLLLLLSSSSSSLLLVVVAVVAEAEEGNIYSLSHVKLIFINALFLVKQ
jgi:hypothetical protein